MDAGGVWHPRPRLVQDLSRALCGRLGGLDPGGWGGITLKRAFSVSINHMGHQERDQVERGCNSGPLAARVLEQLHGVHHGLGRPAACRVVRLRHGNGTTAAW